MQGDLSCQTPITIGLNTDNYLKKVYIKLKKLKIRLNSMSSGIKKKNCSSTVHGMEKNGGGYETLLFG
jgi:hypothetical protein